MTGPGVIMNDPGDEQRGFCEGHGWNHGWALQPPAKGLWLPGNMLDFLR